MQKKSDAKHTIPFKKIHIQNGEIIKITKDMIIGDVVIAYPQTLKIFQKAGIHCIGCYASTFESIQEGTIKHGINPDKICKEINKTLLNQKQNK